MASIRYLIVFCVAVVLPAVEATVYVSNLTYPSLPALFGRYMSDGQLYRARLQFLAENPYLCDDFDENATSFVAPSYAPVVLLASRGNCPFARKAAVAESMGPTVKFLIVYNYELEGEDTLVPMFTETGDSRLILLSVTHRAGRSLREFLMLQGNDVLESGGPIIQMDSKPPPGMLSTEDVQRLMLTAIGMFFMLVSLSGCALVVLSTCGRYHATGHFTLAALPMRTRLTEAQVQALPKASEDTESFQCSICLEDDSTDAWTVLPCQHHFHLECVTPWLTERQPKCPLCKFDVLEHVRENELEEGAKLSDSAMRYLWTKITRSRWTRVNLANHDDDFMGDEQNQIDVIEMSERQQVPPQMQ